MKTYNLDDLRDNLDKIMLNAATGDEFAKIKVNDKLNAIIINEEEWKILCDGLALLIGGTRVK